MHQTKTIVPYSLLLAAVMTKEWIRIRWSPIMSVRSFSHFLASTKLSNRKTKTCIYIFKVIKVDKSAIDQLLAFDDDDDDDEDEESDDTEVRKNARRGRERF